MDNSPLGKLPGELRTQICECVLYQPGGIRIASDSRIPDNFLAITSTCRQARNESSAIPFSINTFHVVPDFKSKKIGRSHVKALCPRFPIWESSGIGKLGMTRISEMKHITIELTRAWPINSDAIVDAESELRRLLKKILPTPRILDRNGTQVNVQLGCMTVFNPIPPLRVSNTITSEPNTMEKTLDSHLELLRSILSGMCKFDSSALVRLAKRQEDLVDMFRRLVEATRRDVAAP